MMRSPQNQVPKRRDRRRRRELQKRKQTPKEVKGATRSLLSARQALQLQPQPLPLAQLQPQQLEPLRQQFPPAQFLLMLLHLQQRVLLTLLSNHLVPLQLQKSQHLPSDLAVNPNDLPSQRWWLLQQPQKLQQLKQAQLKKLRPQLSRLQKFLHLNPLPLPVFLEI
ncbi:hypothetical protein ANCCAN_27678 [Ancylostoma caninum]|uniref:Uncharacterized protein n=1 Tax=Ancylostoma caninum TaxID=29170 RepID=A0A368F3C7_ANCCA|nr:hypothetical protein ANCCAN_27678 [Ancylostoma caninum]